MVDEHEAVKLIDVETIMLLLGMMSIVVILRKSGVFTLLSVKIAEITQVAQVAQLALVRLGTDIDRHGDAELDAAGIVLNDSQSGTTWGFTEGRTS